MILHSMDKQKNNIIFTYKFQEYMHKFRGCLLQHIGDERCMVRETEACGLIRTIRHMLSTIRVILAALLAMVSEVTSYARKVDTPCYKSMDIFFDSKKSVM